MTHRLCVSLCMEVTMTMQDVKDIAKAGVMTLLFLGGVFMICLLG